METLRGMTERELLDWAKAELNLHLDVYADKEALLGRLFRLALPDSCAQGVA